MTSRRRRRQTALIKAARSGPNRLHRGDRRALARAGRTGRIRSRRNGRDSATRPAVISLDVSVPEATLADTLSDLDRISRALPTAPLEIDLSAARQLPATLRGGGWSLRAHMRERELIGFSPTGRRPLGLAIDLGTTNVAGFLVDTRKRPSRVAQPRHRKPAGGLGRRRNQPHEPCDPKRSQLPPNCARPRRRGINAIAHDLCASFGAESADIVDVAICGNTAMHHLLLGLPVRQLGPRAPSSPRCARPWTSRRVSSELTNLPGAYVHVAPNIGGFVGSDHVTALLATEELWRGATTAFGDGHRHKYRDFADPPRQNRPPPPARLPGAGGWPYLLRHAGGGSAIERVAVQNGRLNHRDHRQASAGRPVRLGRD